MDRSDPSTIPIFELFLSDFDGDLEMGGGTTGEDDRVEVDLVVLLFLRLSRSFEFDIESRGWAVLLWLDDFSPRNRLMDEESSPVLAAGNCCCLTVEKGATSANLRGNFGTAVRTSADTSHFYHKVSTSAVWHLGELPFKLTPEPKLILSLSNPVFPESFYSVMVRFRFV